MDLEPLFGRCVAADVDGVLAELERLRLAAVAAAGPGGLPHDVEIAFTPRRQIEAWQRWAALVERGPDGQLEQLLQGARENVPFYRERFAALRPEAALHLGDFDPVGRAEMSARPAAFYRDAIDPNTGRALHITSGTTGRPLIVWMDDAMYYDMCVELYAEAVDATPGLIERVASDAVSVVQLSDHPMTWNGTTRLLALKLSVLRRLVLGSDPQETESALRELAPVVVAGIGSTLATYLKRAPGGRSTVRPGLVVTSGETLHADVRRRIAEGFGCPVLDVYVSSEGGAIAASRRGGAAMDLRPHAARIEVLTASGAIAEEGEGELLVTNLLNHGMPFIRYRSGDLGRLERVPGPGGAPTTRIAALFGRDLPAYVVDGVRVPAHAIGDVLLSAGVADFRLDQIGPDAFSLVYEPGDPACDEAAIATVLAPLLGGARLESTRVAHLPVPGRKTIRYGDRS